jgi:hypothetical protein
LGETLTLPARVEPHRYEASRLRTEEILFYWPWIEVELNKIASVWCGHWTKEALREYAINERVQVWGFGPPDQIRIIAFTQLIDFPAGRVIQVFLCFGNSIDEAMPVIEATFERFAMETESKVCEILGRRGWLKKAPGFKEDYVVMSRVVEQQGMH